MEREKERDWDVEKTTEGKREIDRYRVGGREREKEREYEREYV